jgi:hypothetical protein
VGAAELAAGRAVFADRGVRRCPDLAKPGRGTHGEHGRQDERIIEQLPVTSCHRRVRAQPRGTAGALLGRVVDHGIASARSMQGGIEQPRNGRLAGCRLASITEERQNMALRGELAGRTRGRREDGIKRGAVDLRATVEQVGEQWSHPRAVVDNIEGKRSDQPSGRQREQPGGDTERARPAVAARHP